MSSRFASLRRMADRNLPGDTPVARWKMRVKWNLLNRAVLARSSTVIGSPSCRRSDQRAHCVTFRTAFWKMPGQLAAPENRNWLYPILIAIAVWLFTQLFAREASMTQTPLDSRNRPAPVFAPAQTSLFVNGMFPRRRWLVLGLSVLGGLLVAYAWSAQLADDTIGFNVADALLGRDAKSTPIGGILSGVVFAFVSGLAGSFTACNVAAFGAVGPLV